MLISHYYVIHGLCLFYLFCLFIYCLPFNSVLELSHVTATVTPQPITMVIAEFTLDGKIRCFVSRPPGLYTGFVLTAQPL